METLFFTITKSVSFFEEMETLFLPSQKTPHLGYDDAFYGVTPKSAIFFNGDAFLANGDAF